MLRNNGSFFYKGGVLALLLGMGDTLVYRQPGSTAQDLAFLMTYTFTKNITWSLRFTVCRKVGLNEEAVTLHFFHTCQTTTRCWMCWLSSIVHAYILLPKPNPQTKHRILSTAWQMSQIKKNETGTRQNAGKKSSKNKTQNSKPMMVRARAEYQKKKHLALRSRTEKQKTLVIVSNHNSSCQS